MIYGMHNPNAHNVATFHSPIDGAYISIDAMNVMQTLFNELQKAGELIRELRKEVDALKAKGEDK